MSKRDTRVLRHDADGVTWSISTRGTLARIEIAFDGDPEPVVRERDLTHGEVQQLVDEQLAEGFVLEPPWTPDPAWVREATDQELWGEVVDTWVVHIHAHPESYANLAPAIQNHLAVHLLIGTALRSGLSSFILENDLQLVRRFPAAAREIGRADLAELFERATHGLDLAALSKKGVGVRFSWGDASAVKKLENLLLDFTETDLLPWVRTHADDFAKLPAPPKV